MSLSCIRSETSLIRLAIFQVLIERFISLKNSASTFEENTLIQSQAYELLKKIDELDFPLTEVKQGSYLYTEDLYQTYGEFETLFIVANTKLKTLIQIFMDHYNLSQTSLLAISGKVNRIKQKLATLTIEDGAKYVLSEAFMNLDLLDTSFTSATPLTVKNGVCTLPQTNTKVLELKSLSIGGGSNGVPGNSDEAVTFNNTDLNSLTQSDPNLWFEYERLDSGPLDFYLVLELSKEEIVNCVSISPINLGASLPGIVKDILLTSSTTTSLKEVLKINDPAFWDLQGLSTDWSVIFPPTVAKTIVIQLTQSQEYNIETANGDRDRYAIGLRQVSVQRITFAKTGGINSTQLTLPSYLYLGESFNEIVPSTDLYDLVLEVSLDGGSTWKSGDSFVLDGKECPYIWRLSLDRDDSAISQVSSFYPVEVQPEVNSLLKPVSVVNSPVSIKLPEKPLSSDVFVMQPKIGRRGSRDKKVKVGIGTGTSSSIHLSFNILDIDPDDLKVFVDGREYSRNDDNTYLSTNEWAFSDDFTELEFAETLASGAIVEIILNQELMQFELKADGYYYYPSMLFDPDKDGIDIEVLSSVSQKVSITLPRDKKLIQLGHKNVAGDIQFTAVGSTTLSSVASRNLVKTTTGSYYLDSPNGLLWLNSAIGADTVRASFNTRGSVRVNEFDIVYDKAKPIGVRIPLDQFSAIVYSDTVGEDLIPVINQRTGVYAVREVFAPSDTAIPLSSGHIIKGSLTLSNVFNNPVELDYIDGLSEFFGLTHVEDEKTTALTASGSVVEFNLSAGALWYQPLGVHFSNTVLFATEVVNAAAVNSAGEYYISTSGEVTVYVGPGGTLPSGIELSYYYKDPEFDPLQKYSVDYENGYLYTYSIISQGTITYQASAYMMSYDICRPILSYSYNASETSVEVKTDRLHKVNNLVRVLWQKSNQTEDLSSLVDYFSPVVNSIGWRFA